MAHTDLNKEMVDLVIRIKKHLRDNYQISIALADPELLDRLVKLRNLDDPVLQGMLSYLMALAGPEWSARLDAEDEPATAHEPSAEKKRLFGRYRGKNAATKSDDTRHKTAQERHAETPYRGQHPGEEETPPEEAKKERKPVRYYRGQPIYD